ncbi:hypothetical protein [Neolewinella persica]|uniref:hypothetical protein n=1 Tax=Neolewinella persica TaxID=70998 RepID=UPI000362F53A|nr:hypothetical protein [Neolewinella persica]
MNKSTHLHLNICRNMLKLMIIAACLLVVWSCNQPASKTGSDGIVVGSINNKLPLRQEDGEKEKAPPSLKLRMGEAKVASGGTVCLPVEATGMTNLLGFQFTMRYDSAALKFQSFRGMTLPGYGSSNFGTRFADRGYLSTLWSDTSAGMEGVTRPAGHKLFEVCFTNLLPKGKEAEVRFADGPTYFEVVGLDMKPRQLVYANGKVVSK